MFQLFSKRKSTLLRQQPSKISLLADKLQQRFSAFMQQQDLKYSISQKKCFLLLFCFGIFTIHFARLCGLSTNSHTSTSIPTRSSITTPNTIVIPDSLDITLIRQYRQMKARQKSLTRNEKP